VTGPTATLRRWRWPAELRAQGRRQIQPIIQGSPSSARGAQSSGTNGKPQRQLTNYESPPHGLIRWPWSGVGAAGIGADRGEAGQQGHSTQQQAKPAVSVSRSATLIPGRARECFIGGAAALNGWGERPSSISRKVNPARSALRAHHRLESFGDTAVSGDCQPLEKKKRGAG